MSYEYYRHHKSWPTTQNFRDQRAALGVNTEEEQYVLKSHEYFMTCFAQWNVYDIASCFPDAHLAMCMGLHGRLGAGSGLNSLDSEIIQMICKLALE